MRFFTYKHWTVVLLLVALFIQSFNRVFIISDYYLNTASYAAQCENKQIIDMQCNGKCQMEKKLQQEDEKDQQNPERRIANQSDFYFWDLNSFTIDLAAIYTPKQKFPLLADPFTMDRPHFVFKPPEIA